MDKKIIISVLVFLLSLSLWGCDLFDDLTDHDEQYQVSGRIINESDEPLPRTKLSFSDGFGIAETDNNGYWSKSGLEGEVVVTPSDDYWEFEPPSRSVSREDSNVNFTAVIPADDNGDESDDFAGGTGTFQDPFLVETAQHLDNVRNHLDSQFSQIADIDLANYENKDWEPIASSLNRFEGVYNGDNYKISNLTIEDGGANSGLFSYVGENATVQYLKLENININASNNSGGIAGRNYGRVNYIDISGNLTVSSAGDVITGGLIGLNEGEISFADSSVAVTIEGSGGIVGGLVGHNLGNIDGSSSDGSINLDDGNAGGLVGRNEGNITFSESESNVRSENGADIGGLVGRNEGEEAYIFETEADGDVSGRSRVGGLIGFNTNSAELRSSKASGNVSGNTRLGGLIGENSHSNLLDRQEVRACSASANVTAISERFSNHAGGLIGFNNNSDVINSYASGIVVAKGRGVGGLIGSNTDGLIENSYASGDVLVTDSGDRIGGLIGDAGNDSEIVNSYATGDVEAENSDIGGLIGMLSSGRSEELERVYRSYATGDVRSTGSNVGGLVGSITTSSSGELIGIEESYATGKVISQDRNVGGLVGSLGGDSILKNSYASGDVEGNLGDKWSSAYTGGLVGRAPRAKISNSYAANQVSGIGNNISGLIGGNPTNLSIVVDCYIDSTLSGHGDNEYGFLKSTEEMKQKTTYEAWDFGEVWKIDQVSSHPYVSSYPYLQWE